MQCSNQLLLELEWTIHYIISLTYKDFQNKYFDIYINSCDYYNHFWKEEFNLIQFDLIGN